MVHSMGLDCSTQKVWTQEQSSMEHGVGYQYYELYAAWGHNMHQLLFMEVFYMLLCHNGGLLPLLSI